MEGTHAAFLAGSTPCLHSVQVAGEHTSDPGHHLVSWMLLIIRNHIDLLTSRGLALIVPPVVQSFYAWRVYRLGNGYRWQKPLVSLILVTSLAQFGTGLIANASDMSIGLLTSVVAICTLMTYYIAPPTSLLYTAFDIINGKVYVNSMLVTYVNFVSIVDLCPADPSLRQKKMSKNFSRWHRK
ncbi:hypothetical protein C0995_012430 [Termitomyces sp. Mi166|nr:hypothetical protein C0995_012430 [Termitomyces sp. Mi166\